MGKAGKLVLATVVILSSVIFGQQEIKPSGPKRRYYSKTYTVLSANVGNSNPLERERKYKLHDDLVPRVKEEIQRLKPDILILLEVANQNQIKDICTNSEGQLEYWIYGESYNFLCIRKNIGEVINFQQTSADNKALHLGYLDLMLKNEDIPRKVRLFFVYLPSLLAVGKERKNELDVWGFDWIVKNLPTDSPCLMAGDFNLDFIRDRKNPAAKFIYEKVKDLNLWIFNPLKDPLTTPDGSVNAEYEVTHRPTDLFSDPTIDWVMGEGVVPLFQVPHKDPLKLDIFIPPETTSSVSTPPVLNLPLSDRPLKSFVTSPPDWWQDPSIREISRLTFDHKPLYGEVVFFWEELALEPGSAIAVVMDRSGSMTGEKLAGAKRAADGLFALLNSNDSGCLISFASSSQIEVGLVQATPENKNQLRTGVKSLEAGDSTNITAGLNDALSELSKAHSSKRAVYLLSDGMHNMGIGPLEGNPSIVQRFSELGYPIHTIAYGQGSDPYAGVDLEMLRKIAQLTGGTFWWGTPHNLTQIYHKISAHINNRSVLVSYNDLIKEKEKLNYEVVIESDITSATFFVDWQGSTVELCLITPDKKEINPDNFSKMPGVSYQKGSTYCFYQIIKPKAGKWQASLFGKKIDLPKEPVNFTVSADSPFVANILGFRPQYGQKQKIEILVKVSELFGDKNISLKNIQVTAVIKKPAPNLKKMLKEGEIDLWKFIKHALSNKKKIELREDNSNNNGSTDSKIFVGTYKDADENGQYLVTITVRAETPEGKKLTRILRESIQVGPIEDRSVRLTDFIKMR